MGRLPIFDGSRSIKRLLQLIAPMGTYRQTVLDCPKERISRVYLLAYLRFYGHFLNMFVL